MKKFAPLLVVMSAITGCLSAGPSASEVKNIINAKLVRPGCASSSVFKTFPVTLSERFSGRGGPSKSNSPAFDAFVSVGLLHKTSSFTYDLTDMGRLEYRADQQGFCFASGYQVTSIKDISPLPSDQLGSAIEAGWLATVEIGPIDFHPWIKNPDLKQISSMSMYDIEKMAAPAVHRIAIMREKGSTELTVLGLGSDFYMENTISIGQAF